MFFQTEWVDFERKSGADSSFLAMPHLVEWPKALRFCKEAAGKIIEIRNTQKMIETVVVIMSMEKCKYNTF